jgi:RimJ/RimL family protein N-acetyltransferase
MSTSTSPSSLPPDLVTEPVATERLDLEPLRISHAAEAARAFADERLHTFTGGSPADEAALRERYIVQLRGSSADGSATWLNWMVRRRDTRELVGNVQATVTAEAADVAWVVSVPHQGNGFAREAAGAMTGWLRAQGVRRFTAHIHPDHGASIAVARSLGLFPTDVVVDGEIRWS